MSDPHDIAADLRQAAASVRFENLQHHSPRADRLEALADSFDQPGDGPLAYDPDTGRMVRLEAIESPADYAWAMHVENPVWRFPSRGTPEGDK
jgi:hypothetical protein